MTMKQYDMAKIFKALSSEQRLALFRNLYNWEKNSDRSANRLDSCEASKECCGTEKAFTRACGCMDLSRSTISHHLKELQNAGLVTCTRSGQVISCKVNEEVVELIKHFLD